MGPPQTPHDICARPQAALPTLNDHFNLARGARQEQIAAAGFPLIIPGGGGDGNDFSLGFRI